MESYRREWERASLTLTVVLDEIRKLVKAGAKINLRVLADLERRGVRESRAAFKAVSRCPDKGFRAFGRRCFRDQAANVRKLAKIVRLFASRKATIRRPLDS